MYVVDSAEQNLLKDTRKMLHSHALAMETRLRECVIKFTAAALDPALVNSCTIILEEISLGPGPYSKVLRELSHLLCRAIYVDPKAAPRMAYFQLSEQLRREFLNLEREKADLLQRLRSQEELLSRPASSTAADGSAAEDRDPSADEAEEPGRPGPGPLSRQPSSGDLNPADPEPRALRPVRAPTVLLKKTDFELKAKVIQLQQDLENNMRLRKEAEKASTDLKGAFLRLKRDCADLQDRLQASEAQCQTLFIAMQGPAVGSQPAHGEDDYEREAPEESAAGAPRGDGLTPRPNWFGIPSDVRVACNLAPGKERSAAAVRKLVLAYRKLHRQKAAGAAAAVPPALAGPHPAITGTTVSRVAGPSGRWAPLRSEAWLRADWQPPAARKAEGGRLARFPPDSPAPAARGGRLRAPGAAGLSARGDSERATAARARAYNRGNCGWQNRRGGGRTRRRRRGRPGGTRRC